MVLTVVVDVSPPESLYPVSILKVGRVTGVVRLGRSVPGGHGCDTVCKVVVQVPHEVRGTTQLRGYRQLVSDEDLRVRPDYRG